ncbi:MAG: response regulator [Cellvibrionaceae bacterium]|nr:response regulator [Cellvibrionaceae bacterium]
MRADSIKILMVEDNPGDVELTREAMNSGKLNNTLYVVDDGEQALDFLYRRGDYVDSPRPDLILLDLNLPKINGREVLAEVKGDPALSTIPIIILSSSADTKDIQASYALNANSFVTKPVRIEEFLRVTQAIEHFWIEIVKLPGSGA